jgi:hypothetical protein
MSLLTRKRTVLAKIESVYGTDSVPTGSANAMLIKNLTLTPISASLVSRDLIRPYLGNSEQLLAEKFVQMDFEVEMAGSGAMGLAPGYDVLLRACGFTKSITQTSCTIACASTVCTVTKTSHGYAVGDKIVITGCTDTPKNITATITAVTTNTFTYTAATASDEATAAGSPKLNTAVVYVPVSSSFESLTMYYNVDGLLHKLTGAMGSFDLSLSVKNIPTFKFSFTGIYNAPSDTAAPTVDFSGFMIPAVANTQNTPSFSLFTYSGLLESMSLNLANQVSYVTLIGSESVKILDRKPAGNLVFEAPTIASKDFFSLVSANTSGAMTLNHGPSNGYKVSLSCPSVLLGNPTYQDSNGVQMLSAPFTAQPTSAGNDEISITVK